MNISLIVAAALNNAIGKNNQLLWHLPNDLRFFKNTTWGMPVIMGRKTFESVNKPLPGRINIVITRQKEWEREGVITACNLTDALSKAATTNCKEAFIIGGGQIYAEALPLAKTIFLTRVNVVMDGDTYFPELNGQQWQLVSVDDQLQDEKHAYEYSFQRWERRTTVIS